MNRVKKILKKAGRIFLWIFGGLIVLFIALVLVIRTPAAQDFIIGKATKFVSGRINTPFEIKKLFITFTGNVQLEGLYVADRSNDTLLYSSSLEVGVAFMPLIRGDIQVSRVDWSGVRANVYRSLPDSSFNFDYIIDAFAGKKKNNTEKDTAASEPLRLKIGPVSLSDFELNYTDDVNGMHANLKLGNFFLKTETIDLEKMDFHVVELVLENTSARIAENKILPPSDDTSSTVMPRLRIDELNLEQVNFYYASADSMMANLDLGRLSLEMPQADLAGKRIEIDQLEMTDSRVELNLPVADTTRDIDTSISREPIVLPDWDISLKSFMLSNDRLVYNSGREEPLTGQFDANHIQLDSLSISLKNTLLRNRSLSLEMEKMAFVERSGFRIDTFEFAFKLKPDLLAVDNLLLATGNSRLNTSFEAGFTSLDSLISNLYNARIELFIDNTLLSLKDAVYFSPGIGMDTSLAVFMNRPLGLQASLKGRFDNLDIQHISAQWAGATYFYTKGKIKGLPDPEKLVFDLPVTTLNTVKEDVSLFLPANSGVQLPATVKLNLAVMGSVSDLEAKLALLIPEGRLDLNGNYRDKAGLPQFDGDLKMSRIDLGQILNNQDFGKVEFKLDFEGSGNNLANLDAQFEGNFPKLELKGYDYRNLALKGGLRNEVANIRIDYNDSNLQGNLSASASLDTLNPDYRLQVNLSGGNFYNLNITPKDFRAKMTLSARFTGTPEHFDSKLDISDLVVKQESKTYPTSFLSMKARARYNTTELDIHSDIMDATLRSNAGPQKTVDAVLENLSDYFRKVKERKGGNGNVDVQAKVDFYKTPLVSEVLVPGLDALDSANMRFAFRENDGYLDAALNVPYVKYNGTAANGIALTAKNNGRKLDFSFGFQHLVSGPADIHQTSLSGNMSRDSVNVALNMLNHNEAELVNINAYMVPEGTLSRIHVQHGQLVLNGDDWKMPASNSILIGDHTLVFNNFELSHQEQKLVLESLPGEKKDHLAIEFVKFRLSTFTSILNPDQMPVNGMLQGKILLEELFTKAAFTADMKILDLLVLEQKLGELKIKADNLTENTYKVNMNMGGAGVSLDLAGSYFASDTETKLEMDLDLEELKLELIQGFTDSAIRYSEGSIRGKFEVSGNMDDLKYKGNIRFDKARFNVSSLNATFALANEQIKVDNEGVYFSGFDIRDGKGNRSTLDGTIGTRDITDPSLDLKFTANNFELLNSTRKDNDLFYGKVLLNADIKVDGSVYHPKLNVRTRLNKGSDITFIVPESQVDVVERDGVVIFTNMNNPDDPLTNETETESGGLTGIELKAVIEVDPSTNVKIVIDERSGDNLQLSGEANLSFDMYPNGRMALSGSYEIGRGHYEMSLYNIVKRKFIIVPGSRIVWAGDPLDAVLNLNARYDVRTSAYDLMSAQLGSETDPLMSNSYRQELPFEVYLKINGPLLKPQISFAIDMPENQRAALGGNVYARLQQLNQEESELNKQVFALIVLKRFLPEGTSNDPGNSNESLAKSSVSQVLSDQLNLLSDKYVKGLDVDLNLDSYTDYQTGVAEDRTQLNVSVKKTIFNERVSVQVGSQVDLEGEKQYGQQANDIVGDIVLEYMITKDGRYRLKGFRKNQFEGLVEGQLVVTGVSIVYTRDFNRIKELLKKPAPLPKEPEEEIEDDEEEQQEKEKEEEKPQTPEPQK